MSHDAIFARIVLCELKTVVKSTAVDRTKEDLQAKRPRTPTHIRPRCARTRTDWATTPVPLRPVPRRGAGRGCARGGSGGPTSSPCGVVRCGVSTLIILGELLVLLGEVGEDVLLVGVLVEEGGVVDTDVCREGDVAVVGGGEVLEHECHVAEVVDVAREPHPAGVEEVADEGEERPRDVQQPVEHGLEELLPPALRVEEVEEHDARDAERDDVEDELAHAVAAQVVPLALGLLLVLLVLLVLLLGDLGRALLLLLRLLADGLLHEHLGWG
eukprot:scaffold8016_cov62-Phaeocystis_antarctica.AAC.4